MKPGTLGLAGCGLVAAGLQLLLFLPAISEGRTLDVALWAGGPPMFRVDRLSLTFGVAWTIALALIPLTTSLAPRRWGWVGLVSAGLLVVAYARDPVLFYVGWEAAGLGVWLSMAPPKPVKVSALIHGPGLALLAAIVLGGMTAFAPPEGGAVQVWTLAAVLLLAVATVGRALAPVLTTLNTPLLALLASTGPFALAKTLVAARWDAWGVWTLALVGMATLLGVTGAALRGTHSLFPLSLSATAIIGLGLAPVAPPAAMGAIWLVGLGAFLPFIYTLDSRASYLPWARAAVMAVSLPGVWLVALGAHSAHYDVVAIVILPALMLTAYAETNGRRGDNTATGKVVLCAALLAMLALAVYPQVVIEWFVRPAVGAMAGGVGASTAVTSRWALGLVSAKPNESLTAALPATGIALAVFLAWVALYLLRELLGAITRRAEKRVPPEPQ